jgi:hypothetical protein
MSDKGWLIAGGFLIVFLLGAISLVYFSPTTFFVGLGIKNSVDKPKEVAIRLNENYGDPEEFTEITVNDITDGRLLKQEMASAKPFPEDTLPMKYHRKDVGLYDSKLLIDNDDFAKIKNNFDKAPFRNLYFYKIKGDKKWFTILGQQVRNTDGTSSFLHFVIHQDEEVYSWGRMDFGFQPLIVVIYRFFDFVAPKEFFSSDPHYYELGSEVDKLVTEWQKTGIVPEALSKKILFAEIKM